MKDIELVIKIPECFYEYCKSQKDATEIQLAVAKGKPLQKGHGRLIDVDGLREYFKASKKISFAERMDISCIVDHAPIIIEAESEEV